ncbi:hypothetical protein HDU98_007090 [Podochytrium sp. JEL0797]|nr:hypothetical protein HDU98_007090 [Podochytrium sp. JEL0797]
MIRGQARAKAKPPRAPGKDGPRLDTPRMDAPRKDAPDIETKGRIPATSLWFSAHTPLVDRLMDAVLVLVPETAHDAAWRRSDKTAKGARLATQLLPFLVAQFQNDDAEASRRLVAAKVLLRALDYAAFLDTQRLDVARQPEVKLLVLVALAEMAKQLDTSKLRILFHLPAKTDASLDETELVLETLLDSILSLLDLDCPLPLHDRPEPVRFQIAWRTHWACAELLLSINAAAENAGINGLRMLEFFLKGLLKGLSRLASRPNVSIAQMKVVVAVFADTSSLLTRSITCLPLLASPGHNHPNTIKLMSHPLLLLKHIINPIVRYAIWDSLLQPFVSQTFEELAAHITHACRELTNKNRVGKDKKVSWKEVPNHSSKPSSSTIPGTLPWLISEAVASTTHVAGFLEIISKWLNSDKIRGDPSPGQATTPSSRLESEVDDSASVVSCLDHRTAFDITQWTLYTRVYSTRLVQLFLLPFLEQMAAVGGMLNWKECEDVVVGVYNGRVGKEKLALSSRSGTDPIQPLSTIHYLTKWLITTACVRPEASSDQSKPGISANGSKPPSASSKFPSPEAALNLRKFSILLLGILTNGNREISLCLLSLFTDPTPEIRHLSAASLAIRSLNNDPSHFHIPNACILSSNAIHHRSDGSCVFEDPSDAYGVAHWFRQNDNDGGGQVNVSRREDRWVGVPGALKSPFKYLVWCLDESIGYEDMNNKWQGSNEEQTSFGHWALCITQHLFSTCPVLANPNMYPWTTKNLHLPTLSDPRQKAILKVTHDLSVRLQTKTPIQTNAHAIAYTQHQLTILHTTIAYITTSILEGSNPATNTIAPLCDARVLRALAPLLHTLRTDPTAHIQTIILESLTRVLGLSVLIDRIDSMRFGGQNCVADLLHGEVGVVTREAGESLRILYRLVRGREPFEESGEEVWRSGGRGGEYGESSGAGGYSRVEALREAVLGYGEVVHLRALFRGGEEGERVVGRGGDKFGGEDVRGVEIPLGRGFQWVYREEEEEKRERGGVGRDGGEEMRRSRRREEGRDLRGKEGGEAGVGDEVPRGKVFQWGHGEEEERGGGSGVANVESGVDELTGSRRRSEASGLRDQRGEGFSGIPAAASVPVFAAAAPPISRGTVPTRSETQSVFSNPHSTAPVGGAFEQQQPSSKFDLDVLRDIAREEAQVLEEFRRRIHKEPVLDHLSPSLADKKRPQSPNRMSWSVNALASRSAPANEQPHRFSTSTSQMDRHTHKPPPVSGEGASVLFRKTENYFADAFDALKISPAPSPHSARVSSGCLNDELESIVSEHESSLKQCEAIASSVLTPESRLSRNSLDTRAPTTTTGTTYSAEGPSFFVPIEIGDVSGVAPTGSRVGNESFRIRPRTPATESWNSQPLRMQRPVEYTRAASEAVLHSAGGLERGGSSHYRSVSGLPVKQASPPPSAHARISPELKVGAGAERQIPANSTTSSSPILNPRASLRATALKPSASSAILGRGSVLKSPEPPLLQPKPTLLPKPRSPLSNTPLFGSSTSSVSSSSGIRKSQVRSMQSVSPNPQRVPPVAPASLPTSPPPATFKNFSESHSRSPHKLSELAGTTNSATHLPSREPAESSSAFFDTLTSQINHAVNTNESNHSSLSMPRSVSKLSSPRISSIGRTTPATPTVRKTPSPVASLHLSRPAFSSLIQTPAPVSASGVDAGNAIQNTWLLRRMEYATSPSQTPAHVKSPSMRVKSGRVFSEGAGKSGGGGAAGGRREDVVGREERDDGQMNLDVLGVSDGGRMDMEELSRPELKDPVESKLVNLDAFLAGNGLHHVDQEVEEEDGRGFEEYPAQEGLTGDGGGGGYTFDESDFFAGSKFHSNESSLRGGGERGDAGVSPRVTPMSSSRSGYGAIAPSTHDFLFPTQSIHRSRRLSDPFLGDTQFHDQPVLRPQTPPQPMETQDVVAPFTGMSIFQTDSLENEPSGIAVTPGSPVSFSWTGSQPNLSLTRGDTNGVEEEEEEGEGGLDYEFDETDQRQISMELGQRNDHTDHQPAAGQSSTLSFFKNAPSSSNLMANMSTTMVRPRLRAALELVLRHLVFTHAPRGAKSPPAHLDHSDLIDYTDLYSEGLVYGSLVNLAALPVAGNAMGNKQAASFGEEEETPVSEALHPLLKSVFQLDMSLMVDLCGPLTMGRVASESILEEEWKGPKRLRKWLAGLTELHRFLLPTSRAIFHVERQLASQLTLAQAMVVVKDQISVARMMGGGGGLYNMDGTNFGGGGARDSAPFLEWVSAACHSK